MKNLFLSGFFSRESNLSATRGFNCRRSRYEDVATITTCYHIAFTHASCYGVFQMRHSKLWVIKIECWLAIYRQSIVVVPY